MLFRSDHGYIFVGSAGDKDPLYPSMDGKTLLVDYDLTEHAEVPEYLGGDIIGMSMYRYKMVEKIDAEQFGLFVIDPVVE